jgi:hypothetical protein
VYLLVSECMTSKEALSNWQWLDREVMPGLNDFDDPAECSEYVRVKVESQGRDSPNSVNNLLINYLAGYS